MSSDAGDFLMLSDCAQANNSSLYYELFCWLASTQVDLASNMAALLPTEDAKFVTGGAIGALLAPRFGTTTMHVTPPPGDFLLALAATQQNRALYKTTRRSRAQRERVSLGSSASGPGGGLSGAVFSASSCSPAVVCNVESSVGAPAVRQQAPTVSSNFFMALQSSML